MLPLPYPARLAHASLTFFLVSLLPASICLAAAHAAGPKLRVALVSGAADRPAYDTDRTLEKLKRNLEALYPMDCTLVLPNPGDEDFDNIAALRDADVALFFVRRRTPSAETLDAIRQYVDSGKGLVAVGPTSHAWENWPSFDRDVLGAAYGGPYAEGLGVTDLRIHNHPIFTGGEDFTTYRYVYKYTEFAPDVQVLMEAGHGPDLTPVAWTRERNGSRIFYIGPARKADFDQVSYFRIIANSIFWAARKEIPGAGTRVHRTWMPDAHPSSFAVGFSSGLNFCFDPMLGGVAYAWDGDYVDLWPTVAGKFPRDAGVQGRIFFRTSGESPFRPERGAPAEVRFRGYRLAEDLPEFQYEIDELSVRESIRPQEDRSGLVRHFRVETGARAFRFLPDDPARVTVHQGSARLVDGQLQLPARSIVEFSVLLPR
jgi:type 1 glutamine amidotransferase